MEHLVLTVGEAHVPELDFGRSRGRLGRQMLHPLVGQLRSIHDVLDAVEAAAHDRETRRVAVERLDGREHIEDEEHEADRERRC